MKSGELWWTSVCERFLSWVSTLTRLFVHTLLLTEEACGVNEFRDESQVASWRWLAWSPSIVMKFSFRKVPDRVEYLDSGDYLISPLLLTVDWRGLCCNWVLWRISSCLVLYRLRNISAQTNVTDGLNQSCDFICLPVDRVALYVWEVICWQPLIAVAENWKHLWSLTDAVLALFLKFYFFSSSLTVAVIQTGELSHAQAIIQSFGMEETHGRFVLTNFSC
jgi:hypothetical protein